MLFRSDARIQSGINATWKAITEAFSTYVTTPLSKAWASLTDMAQSTWQKIANGATDAFRGTLQFIADRINQVSGLINQLIEGYNNLPNFGDISLIPQLTVPAFAQGGVATRPMLAKVGDGGENEYIIPASKMQVASSRYLAGARGASVIPSGRSAAVPAAAFAPAQINITTGPVLQQDGQPWVTMQDLEQAVRATEAGIYARLRTPAARMALGIA